MKCLLARNGAPGNSAHGVSVIYRAIGAVHIASEYLYPTKKRLRHSFLFSFSEEGLDEDVHCERWRRPASQRLDRFGEEAVAVHHPPSLLERRVRRWPVRSPLDDVGNF